LAQAVFAAYSGFGKSAFQLQTPTEQVCTQARFGIEGRLSGV